MAASYGAIGELVEGAAGEFVDAAVELVPFASGVAVAGGAETGAAGVLVRRPLAVSIQSSTDGFEG